MPDGSIHSATTVSWPNENRVSAASTKYSLLRKLSRVGSRRVANAWLCVLCFVAAPLSVGAQQYPVRPLRLVVPFPPGGSADTVARIVSQKLSESFAQQVVVDNRPGAATIIGSDIVAKAAPDGHTVLLGSVGLTINATLMSKLPFDPLRDLAPVTLVTSAPNILVVNPAVVAGSVQDLIVLARAKPRQINFGSAGTGTGNHLAGEMFKVMAGIDIVHVPYKGDAPAVTELVGGQIQMLFVGLAPVLGYVKAGRLRPLAVTSLKRSSLLPDLPTVAESGLPGFESNTWAGLFLPAGTPQPVISRLHAEVARILSLADVKQKLASLAFEAVGNDPQAFGHYVRSEIAKWARVIRQANVRVE
ncbi:MAG: tripartite tricarboxylate transporter substrate binding protein [Betaproteobacteria bacterium]|nr:tripartite tricarboxylate transporter substrate binding protein [Betaproteobacteria bacterium]